MSPPVTPLLQVRGLAVHHAVEEGLLLRRRVGIVRAVDGVDLEIGPGETLGLVGESGCGKSSTGRAILRLDELAAGTMTFHGLPLHALTGERLRRVRRELQMVFQDPYGSLDPRRTIGEAVLEPLRAFDEDDRERRVREELQRCGIPPRLAGRYPHEFSGGQRQRVAIARALVLRPRLVVCDEPVSAVDVSIRAQLLNLFADRQREDGVAYLFIAHDLPAVCHLSHRVAVMYLGCIVELAPAGALRGGALHPYTQALVSAVPAVDPRRERTRRRIVLRGEVPSPLALPTGCRFHTRCPRYGMLAPAERARCAGEVPKLRVLGPGHEVACHHAGPAA